MGSAVESTRVQSLSAKPENRRGTFVLYWMWQSVRTRRNAALAHAVQTANRLSLPLLAAFVVDDAQPHMTLRHFAFLFDALRDVEGGLRARGVPFVAVRASAVEALPRLAEGGAAAVVTDASYLRFGRSAREEVARRVGVPVVQVEADVVVPVRVASEKQEFAARTIRPKIHRVMAKYMVEVPELEVACKEKEVDVDKVVQGLEVIDLQKGLRGVVDKLDTDKGATVVEGVRGGEKEGEKLLRAFLKDKLKDYGEMRNEPAAGGQSGLSPYLRFGNLSPVYVAMEALKASREASANKKRVTDSVDSFVEELVVRRELAANFVFYARDTYDSFTSLPAYAQQTLKEHERDKRAYVYSYEELEAGCTHDDYWNAAQLEMVVRGKMHGYMRMYWAKKILEWVKSPETALKYALQLNHRWELDAEDPNSYAGVLWCFGLHDRGWTERKIFGKVRYMNDSGLKRKFNMQGYVSKIQALVKKHGLPPELQKVVEKRQRQNGKTKITDFLESRTPPRRKKRKVAK